MTRPLSIPLTPGLPDAGATGQWLGRDRHGAVYTLRWMPEKQCFGALGWSATHRKQPWPHLVLLQGEQQGFIVGHVEGPAIEPAPREGFLTAALQDLARNDRAAFVPLAARAGSEAAALAARAAQIEAETGLSKADPSFAAWLWTALMLFGLPALALSLVVATVALVPRGDCKPDPARGTTGLFTCRSAK